MFSFAKISVKSAQALVAVQMVTLNVLMMHVRVKPDMLM